MRLTGRAAAMYAVSVICVLVGVLVLKETWSDYAYAAGLAESLQEWTKGKNRYTAASFELSQLSQSFPDQPLPFETRAMILVSRSETWPEARELLGLITERWPERGSAWLSLGTLEFREGNLKAAGEAFEKAAELLSEAAEPLLGQAAVAWNEADLPRTAALLDKAEDLTCGYEGTLARELLSMHVSLAEDDWDGAVEHCKRAFAVSPQRQELGPEFSSLLIRGLLDSGARDALPDRIALVTRLIDETEPALKGSTGKNRWFLSAERWRLLMAIGMAYTTLENWKEAADYVDLAVSEVGRDAPAELYLTKGLSLSRVVELLPDDDSRSKLAREAAHAFFEATKKLQEQSPKPVEKLMLAFGNAAIMRVRAGDYPNGLKVCKALNSALDETELDTWLFLVQATCNDHRGGRYLETAQEYYKRALDAHIEDDDTRLRVVDRVRAIDRED